MASTKKGYPVQVLNKYWKDLAESDVEDYQLASIADTFNSGAAWTYNWNSQIPQFLLDKLTAKGIDYSPCIWGPSNNISQVLAQSSNPKFILGYNEPDQSGQANMTTTQVIDGWAAIADAAPAGTILVGPAISDGQFAYQKTIYDGLRSNGYRFDAIGMHLYRTDLTNFGFGTSAYSIPSMADNYGVPVVISEFGYVNWTRTQPYNDSEVPLILSNLATFIAQCESSEDVLRYCMYPAPEGRGRYHAWFNFMTNIGGNYTDLYKWYASL